MSANGVQLCFEPDSLTFIVWPKLSLKYILLGSKDSEVWNAMKISRTTVWQAFSCLDGNKAVRRVKQNRVTERNYREKLKVFSID